MSSGSKSSAEFDAIESTNHALHLLSRVLRSQLEAASVLPDFNSQTAARDAAFTALMKRTVDVMLSVYDTFRPVASLPPPLLAPAYSKVNESIPWINTSEGGLLVDLKHATFKDHTAKAFAEACFSAACHQFNAIEGDKVHRRSYIATARADYKLHKGKRADSDDDNAPDLTITFCDRATGKVLKTTAVECKMIGSPTESYQVHVSTRVRNAPAYFVVMAGPADFKQPIYQRPPDEKASQLLLEKYIRAFALVDTRELEGTWDKPHFRINLDKADTDKPTVRRIRRKATEFESLKLAARADWPCSQVPDTCHALIQHLVTWLGQVMAHESKKIQ